jgi:hypothetical protein
MDIEVEFKAGETEKIIEVPIISFDDSNGKRRRMEREIRNMDHNK